MSILPSDTHQSSSSSSSSFTPQNPNSNHGITIDAHQFLQHQQHPQFVDSMPGEGAADSSGSSQKVIGHVSSNGKKLSSYQSSNGGIQSLSAVQGGVESSQPNGEVSGSPPTRRPNGSAGRKSQIVSGNHLLNFQYNPISHSRSQPRGPLPRRFHKIKPYNKDLFLQANYRFVVLDSGNYTVESMDPDKLLQWEDIICVKYSTPHAVQCPICLGSLLCAQITSCGHIFCFPCILQYFLIGEQNPKAECWRKCPLCFIMISSKDLYTIYIENVKEHNVGDTIEFSLLSRKKDSFLAHEKKGGMSTKACESFSKFVLTSDVELSVRQAISDLDSWLVRADSGLVDDMEKLPYVCAAMEQLKQRKKYWNAHRNSEGNKSSYLNCASNELELGTSSLNKIHDTNKGTDNEVADILQGGACFVQSSDTDESLEGQDGASSSSYDESKTLQFQHDASRDDKDRDFYHYYQAVDGQHIVLHPLNLKCLLQHYGCFDLLPSRLSGRILQLESVTQSESMRRRYRYLSHFPLTTTFQLCEIDLREILPREALSLFMDEIKKREKQRKWLAKKEHEDKVNADAVAAYSLPIPYNVMQASFDGPLTFSMDDFEALGSSSPVVSSPPIHGGRQLFSSVARLGFAAAHDSPSLNARELSPLPYVENRTDSVAVTGSKNQGACSFANVISQEKSSESKSSPKTNETGKKGKKQNRVLLSTSGGRRY